ncbi:probable U3 small nucleolar RNA-associated protein 7 [Phalaenopsis equestris]|uniref:probable U3 small nucleolar RNA-associated protein 7 n=1 Tax=Phalaenopsis equestris TaxID=78828 RepID=UPI0009E19001|nr:probable U3 small nucleolar RNA-associated protein 7 [Phalaenopsis equestris]XP_020591675.1 probable U3 small nucleolar RNA-associated protein 7 [Phalaenopsis equestris]
MVVSLENMETEKFNVGGKQENFEELDPNAKKYLRGDGANLEVLRDKKLKGQLTVKEKLYGQSAKAAAIAEKWLLPTEHGYLEAEGLEKTWRIKQETILQEVDIISSRKPFDMVLPDLGPYTLEYTLNGRYMLVGGRKGHLALIDMITMDLIKEFQVRETVRDVVFLHNEQFFAVAQKRYTYIYNRHGTEIHCLKEHGTPLKLQFLEKQFLLVSINKFGQLHYQDVSTGEIVNNYGTSLGRTDVMETNPYNAITSLGHAGGKITMWKPTSTKPLVTMLCHHGPITSIAFHHNGHLMASAGIDRKIKLWDIRKFQVLRSYSGYAQSLDFSQKGLLAMSNGSQIHIWRDPNGGRDYGRYMNHSMIKGYQIGKLCFRPYEDVLGIGHSMGISSILVPGSGEANFDSWVANPYETKKQRREKEVHSLLDKLLPETIMLDPSKIGTVRPTRKKERKSRSEVEDELEETVQKAKSIKFKNKTKGRSKSSRKAKKKEEVVLKAKRSFREHHQEEEQPLKKAKVDETELPKSLQRFARKKT